MPRPIHLLLSAVAATCLAGCVSSPARPDHAVVNVAVIGPDRVSFEGQTLPLEELPHHLRHAGVDPQSEVRVRFPDIHNQQQISLVYRILVANGFTRVMPVGERQVSSQVGSGRRPTP